MVILKTELEKTDEVIGAYSIAYVSASPDESRFYVNYPNGSVAVFQFAGLAKEYADEYNRNNKH